MIKVNTILWPTDLSEYAAQALPYAVEMARSFRARLHLLHVIDPLWLAPTRGAEFPGPAAGDIAPLQKSAAEELRHLQAGVEGVEGVKVETAVGTGVPHAEIVRYAREENIDLIVLTTHGRTGLSHALIGSAAEKVVQMATCPVLTIKHPEHEFVLP